jgi:proline dehydrogenase
MGLLRSLLLKASENRWLAEHLPHYAFSRRAVRRFMPGEELADALAESAVLRQSGAGSIITRLGENISSTKEAGAVTTHYLDALRDIERSALPTHLSVKLTQLGLDIDVDYAAACTERITRQSAALQKPVWIDMEGSKYTQVTLDVFQRIRTQHENVGVCVQAYLHRTVQDIDDLLATTSAIRLVKGAYQESAQVAMQSKSEVDRNYFRCAVRLLEAARTRVTGHAPGFATHDVAIIRSISERAREMGVPRENFEFQMLYGINRAEQQRLLREGYRLRVLISYGSAWFAWYMRRLAERPANVWFVAKSIVKA